MLVCIHHCTIAKTNYGNIYLFIFIDVMLELFPFLFLLLLFTIYFYLTKKNSYIFPNNFYSKKA